MKLLPFVCLGCFVCGVYAADNGYMPNVYQDISQKAQQNAKKLDGWKVIGGVIYSISGFDSSLRGGTVTTTNEIKGMMLSVGIDYTKRIKKKFVVGGNCVIDIWKPQQVSGDWLLINADYHNRKGMGTNGYIQAGTLEGKIKTPFIIPELALKGGYIFRNFDSVVSMKLGLQYLRAEYEFSVSGKSVDKFTASKILPLFGLGFYKRINKKFGIMCELNFAFKGEYGKQIYDCYHKIDLSRKDVRLLATYSIPSSVIN